MLRKLLILLLITIPLITSAQNKPADSGIIYYTLGEDTTVIQYFEYEKDQFKTTFIQFTGAITKCEATGLLSNQGELNEVRSANYRMNAAGNWELSTNGLNKFTGDSTIYTASNAKGEQVNRRSFPGQGILANGMDIASFYVFPYMGFYAPEKTGGIHMHRQLSFNGYRAYSVARIDPGHLRVGSNLMGKIELYVDGEGRLLKIEGVGSSLNIRATINRYFASTEVLDAIARRRNAAGATAVRTLRDTARVELGGEVIEVDYWRPHKRGRDIFGNVVVWNRIWRMGANNATQLRTPLNLLIGEYEVLKGAYGLWTFPTAAKWELLVNTNAGAWGTDHDGLADLFRVPWKVERLESPVEILKIYFVKQSEKEADLVLEWDTYKASVRIGIR